MSRPTRSLPTGPRPAHVRGASALLASALLASALLASACVTPAPEPRWTPLPEPPLDSVDAVIFLVGDAGKALPGLSPTLARLTGEVERWSAGLGRDSAVRVVFLGDNAYEHGVHDRDQREFPLDSLHIRAQVDVVSGPMATRNGTAAYFLAGNHDWAQGTGADGLARLRNQEALLEALHAAAGAPGGLVPPAGRAGPVVTDVGRHVRLVFLDTHWWLLAYDPAVGRAIVEDLEEILRTRGDRQVVLVGHHPFQSGGSHGVTAPLWRGLGIRGLLSRTGAVVQDLSSSPYRDLLAGLRVAFGLAGPPLVFAAGHDHNLQVIEGMAPDEPRWSLVSGSGSKLTTVGAVPGMKLGLDQTGFMRLTILVDGSVHLHVEATPAVPVCDPDRQDPRACMGSALGAFRTVFAARLR